MARWVLSKEIDELGIKYGLVRVANRCNRGHHKEKTRARQLTLTIN